MCLLFSGGSGKRLKVYIIRLIRMLVWYILMKKCLFIFDLIRIMSSMFYISVCMKLEVGFVRVI